MSEINSGVEKIDEILFPKLAALIKDDQNAANRQFVKQGKINQNVASLDDDPGGKKEKQVTRGFVKRHGFLFSDHLIVAKKATKKRYDVKLVLNLFDKEVRIDPDSLFCFFLCSREKQIHFSLANTDERNSWFDAMRIAISRHTQNVTQKTGVIGNLSTSQHMGIPSQTFIVLMFPEEKTTVPVKDDSPWLDKHVREFVQSVAASKFITLGQGFLILEGQQSQNQITFGTVRDYLGKTLFIKEKIHDSTITSSASEDKPPLSARGRKVVDEDKACMDGIENLKPKTQRSLSLFGLTKPENTATPRGTSDRRPMLGVEEGQKSPVSPRTPKGGKGPERPSADVLGRKGSILATREKRDGTESGDTGGSGSAPIINITGINRGRPGSLADSEDTEGDDGHGSAMSPDRKLNKRFSVRFPVRNKSVSAFEDFSQRELPAGLKVTTGTSKQAYSIFRKNGQEQRDIYGKKLLKRMEVDTSMPNPKEQGKDKNAAPTIKPLKFSKAVLVNPFYLYGSRMLPNEEDYYNIYAQRTRVPSRAPTKQPTTGGLGPLGGPAPDVSPRTVTKPTEELGEAVLSDFCSALAMNDSDAITLSLNMNSNGRLRGSNSNFQPPTNTAPTTNNNTLTPILVQYQPPPSHIFNQPNTQNGMKNSGESNAKRPLYPNNSPNGPNTGEKSGKLYNSVDSLRLPSSLSNSTSGTSDSSRAGGALPRAQTSTEYTSSSPMKNSSGGSSLQGSVGSMSNSYDPSVPREFQTMPNRNLKGSFKEYQAPVIVAPPPEVYKPSSSLAPLRPTTKSYEQPAPQRPPSSGYTSLTSAHANLHHHATTGHSSTTHHNPPQPFAVYPNEGENGASTGVTLPPQVPLRQSYGQPQYHTQNNRSPTHHQGQGRVQGLNLGGSSGHVPTTGQYATNPNPLRSPRGMQGQIGTSISGLSPRQLQTISPRSRTDSDTSKSDANSAIDDYNRSLASTSFTINLQPVDGHGTAEPEKPEENFTAIFSPRRKKDKGVSPRTAMNYSESPRSPRAGYSPVKY